MPHMELTHHQGSTFVCMGVHMRLCFAASKGKCLFNRGCADAAVSCSFDVVGGTMGLRFVNLSKSIAPFHEAK